MINIRRIVTGHDSNGKAAVVMDDIATNRKYPTSEMTSILMWATDGTPADMLTPGDNGAWQLGTAPPAGGTRFTILEVQPGSTLHPLHRTDTVDYIICMSGEIEMQLEDSCVTLHAGDVMIQRGTYHSWVNRGTAPARFACILIDGVPKREGSIQPGQQAK